MGAIAIALLAGCARAPFEAAGAGPPGRASASRPNLLVVVVDGLRRDALGVFGAGPGATPRLDRLAEQSVCFSKASATSSWNVAALASMWTGLAPSEHGLQGCGAVLPDELPSIATVLQRAGYATGAVVSEFRLGKGRGFDQGFELFDDSTALGDDAVTSSEVTATAKVLLSALALDERPFFAWVHYHDPYPSWPAATGTSPARPAGSSLRGGETLAELRLAAPELSASEKEFVRALYAEEVRATDAAIGRLLDALEELGLEDDTCVILTATHGVELFERGDCGPATSLFEEQVAVPFCVRLPKSRSAQLATQPISTASLAATLADLAEIAPAERDLRAAPSLAGRWAGRPLARRPLRFELDYRPALESQTDRARAFEGASDGRFKLVLGGGSKALFDLALDPFETEDVSALYPEVALQLAGALESAAE